MKKEIVAVNPCKYVERHPTTARDRVLKDDEVPQFWNAFDDAGLTVSTALKLLLLTGQRPGEVAHMRREHIGKDGWWELPGAVDPKTGWRGTKNKQTHRVYLPAAAQALLRYYDGGEGEGRIFKFGAGALNEAMRNICAKLKLPRATPHDLRRSHGTTITALGFGRDAMNRVQNHREGGIADVYDVHDYADENRRIMELVATKIMSLIDGDAGGNVVRAQFAR